MSTAADALAFVLRHLAFNLQVAMEYRVSFLTQVLFMVANDVLLLFFWWILFQQVPDVGGWGQRETMLLIGVCAASFGVAAVCAGNVFRLSRLIAEGQLDVYLLLPRDPLVHALIGRTVIAGVGDFLFGLGAILFLGPRTVSGLAAVAVAILTSAATFVSFGVIVHALAFWFGNASGLASFLHESLLALGMYPESIYGSRLRLLLYTALPVGFFVHVPVRLLREPDPRILAIAILCAAGWVWLARRVWRSGLARYQSGNLISART